MPVVMVPAAEAAGDMLAHAVHLPGRRLPKGHVLTDRDCATLAAAGFSALPVLRPGARELGEDEAARAAAEALAGPHLEIGAIARGRADILAGAAGILVVDAGAIARLNAGDDGIRLATVAPGPVAAGRRVASIKVIPLTLPESACARWRKAIAARRRPPLALHPFRPLSAVLVETRPVLPGARPAKSYAGALSARLDALGGQLSETVAAPHETGALAALLRRLHRRLRAGVAIVIGPAASAVAVDDVVPAAITRAGGRILSFGLAVEPGNLLVTARIGRRPVVVLPSSARSPAPQGTDLVLARLAAGLAVDAAALAGLGVGGLLGAAPERGRPASRGGRLPRLAVILLAAGAARRFGGGKLLALWRGRPLVAQAAGIFRHPAIAARFAVLRPDDEKTATVLAGAGFVPVPAPRALEGLAESLKAGAGAVAAAERAEGRPFDGVFVMLGDMPAVRPETVAALIEAFTPLLRADEPEADAVLPVHAGRPGHPVLLLRPALDLVETLQGDVGLKPLFKSGRLKARELAVGDPGVVLDVDDMAALAALEARLGGDAG